MEIPEMVLRYDPGLLVRWKQGEDLPFVLGRRAYADHQPAYHFGEALVLAHFHVTEGWLGSTDYMILPEIEPGILRHEEGRRLLESVAPPERLSALRAECRRDPSGRKGNGEPDVFLCKPTGEMRFFEVKKGGDRVRANQLDCLAQIRHHLGCEVGVVYLLEEGRKERPARTYVSTWTPGR